MVGRLEDWMRVVCERDGILVTPGRTEWAGVAVFKRAYAIYRERGYRTRLLGGAFRNHLPWSQLDRRRHHPDDPAGLATAAQRVRARDPATNRRAGRRRHPVRAPRRIPDFRRAYEPGGLSPDELEGYGAAVRTLRQFITAYHDLQGQVRDFVLPDPDKRVPKEKQ